MEDFDAKADINLDELLMIQGNFHVHVLCFNIVFFIAPVIGTFECFESGHCLFDLTSPGANPKMT